MNGPSVADAGGAGTNVEQAPIVAPLRHSRNPNYFQDAHIYAGVYLFTGEWLLRFRCPTDGYPFSAPNNVNGVDDGYQGGYGALANPPDSILYHSDADWVAPSAWLSPAQSCGTGTPTCKVNINESDHSCFGMWNDTPQKNRSYAWENFTTGNQVLFMDPYLAYAPSGGTFTLDLSAMPSSRTTL